MLNSYQVIQQLTIISKMLVSEYDAPKKEALEYAIRVINERIESQEPCVFDLGMTCSALTSKQCIGCSFRCSKKEHEHETDKSANQGKTGGARRSASQDRRLHEA